MNDFLNQPPNIPEHKLVRPIGRGGYGEVWLATSELGSTRAIKIVRRCFFDDERPYEREWKGIIEYEPISRKHDGLISILQVGRNDGEGLFYYVMELADAVNGGDSSDLENYTPHSLKMDMEEDQTFSLEKTFSVMDSLLGALDYLHSNNLVHRDIKPSNILYLEGRPCLADPGLISSMDASLSVVGTIGYMPREGPGRTTGDVFSMGIVLYEMMTGNERNLFPELPKNFLSKNSDVVSGLNQSMMKACDDNAQKRYQNAGEFLHGIQRIMDGSRTERSRIASLSLKIAASIIACIPIVLFVWWSNNPNPPESDEGSWDFDYSYTHVHATNALVHIVEKQNIQKFTEWQRPPHTYWAPVKNDSIAKLTYRFDFPNPTSEVYLHADCDAWSFESDSNNQSKAKGAAAILASVDGQNWIDLMNRISPTVIWGDTTGNDQALGYRNNLPEELIGSNQLWIQVQMLCSGVSKDSSFYPVQHGRSDKYSAENPPLKKIFVLRAHYDNEAKSDNSEVPKSLPEFTSEKANQLKGLDSAYEIVTGSFSWHEAKENARKRGGHLAVITSKGENEKIKNLILNHSEEYPHLWAGGTDEVKEGEWVWITGEAWKFESWFRLTNMPDWPEIREPGNDLGSEHYLQVYREPDPPLKGGIYWNDAPSRPSRNHGYILERGKSEVVEKLIASGREANSRRDYDQAMALFKKALEMDPNSFDALFELASLASYVGRELLSLETWDRAIEIHPNDIAARSNRASVLSILKRLDQAENEWKTVIEMDPENAVAHHSIGTFYKDERGDRAKCTMHYKRALEIDPNHRFKSEMIDWLARNRAN